MCGDEFVYVAKIFSICYKQCTKAKDFNKCVDRCVKDYLDR